MQNEIQKTANKPDLDSVMDILWEKFNSKFKDDKNASLFKYIGNLASFGMITPEAGQFLKLKYLAQLMKNHFGLKNGAKADINEKGGGEAFASPSSDFGYNGTNLQNLAINPQNGAKASPLNEIGQNITQIVASTNPEPTQNETPQADAQIPPALANSPIYQAETLNNNNNSNLAETKGENLFQESFDAFLKDREPLRAYLQELSLSDFEKSRILKLVLALENLKMARENAQKEPLKNLEDINHYAISKLNTPSASSASGALSENHIFTRGEISNMSEKDFEKNEKIILDQLARGLIK